MWLPRIGAIVLCFFAWAGWADSYSPAPKIDPTFDHYVKEFIATSRGKITEKDFKNVVIEFAKLKPDPKDGVIPLATCQQGFLGITDSVIDIDTDYWIKTKDKPMDRWSTVFHELGHCLCGENHTAGDVGFFISLLESLGIDTVRYKEIFFDDSCPKSLMYPYDFPEECVKKHIEEYIPELFSKCNPPTIWLKTVHSATHVTHSHLTCNY